MPALRYVIPTGNGTARVHGGVDRLFGTPCLYADLFLDRLADEGGRGRLSRLPDAAELILTDNSSP